MKNMYLNLTQMLQGCSKRNGMTVRASNPDGEPTVNRQSRLMSLSGKKAEKEQLSPSCLLSASFPLSFRSRYLRYAAMIFCVLAMSMANVGTVWGVDFAMELDQIRVLPTHSAFVQISGTESTTVGSGKLKMAKSTSGTFTFTATVPGTYKIKSIAFTLNNAAESFTCTSGGTLSGSDKSWTFTPTSGTPTSTATFSMTAGSSKDVQITPTVTMTTGETITIEELKTFTYSDPNFSFTSSVATSQVTIKNKAGASASSSNYINLSKSSNERSITIAAKTGYNLKFISFYYYDAESAPSATPSVTTYTASTHTWIPSSTVTSVDFSFDASSAGIKIWKIYVGYEEASSCTAPTSPSISPSNGWLYVPGEEITLTASATGTSSTTTYTWYRGATLEAAKAAGAIQAAKTSAQGGTTYTIASCTASDAYKYWCEISNGTGREASASYDIKVYTFFLYNNDNSNNSSHAFSYIDRTNEKLSVTFDVENSDYTYYFKVSDGLGTWYGKNDYTITSSTNYCDGLSSSGANVGWTTTYPGSYTIDYYYASNNIVINYPTRNQAAGKTVYFDNHLTDMSNMYIRIGNKSYASASSAITTLVDGTKSLYQASTIAWDGFYAWSIADNGGWTDKNTIYQPWKDGETIKPNGVYTITKQTNFQNYVVDETITLIPTSVNNTENGCTYYNVTKYSGQKTYTVTTSDNTNCTVTLQKCTNYGSSTYTSLSSGETVLPTQYIKVTITPTAGYEYSSISITNATEVTAPTAGSPVGVYYVTGNSAISVTCSAASYTVTLNNEDATTAGAASVSATYGSAMPSIAADKPAKTGYTFGGYYSAAAGSGTKYYNADGSSAKKSDFTAAGNLYALWTQSVTIDDNGGSADGSVDVTYKGTAGTPSVPTYAGHTVDLGYYAESSCTNKVMALDGTLQTSVTDGSSVVWTNSSSKWAHAGASTLYAHWKCNTPEISCSSNTITISVPSGATVYYTTTTDGSTPADPTSSSTAYNPSSKPTISADTKIKAIAIQSGCTNSAIASASLTYVAPGPSYTAPTSALDISAQTSLTAAGLITANYATQSNYLSTNTDTLLLIPSDIYYNIGNGKKNTWATANGSPSNTSADWSCPAGSVSFKGRTWWKSGGNINTLQVRSDRSLNIRVKGCKTVSVLNAANSSTQYFVMEAYEYDDGYKSSDPDVSASNTSTSVTETSLSLNSSKEYVVVLHGNTEHNNKVYEIKFIAPSSGYTVSITADPDGYGTVSSSSVTSVASGTTLSASTNTLSVGATNVTATPADASAQYTYAFSNWTKSDGTALPSTVTADLSVYANFTRSANSYTLAWSSNGGSDLAGDYTSGSTAYGASITAPTDPTLSNYTFDGWKTNNDGTGTTAGATMPAAATTYYAAWKQTVTLKTGAQGSGADQTPYVYINGATLNGFSAHTATGYTLQGYYTAGSGGVKVLNADGTFASANVDGYITSSKWSRTGAAPTLFAQWVASEDCSTSDFVIRKGDAKEYQGCMESSSYNGTATSFTAGSPTTVGNAKMTISNYDGGIKRPGSGNTFSIVIEPVSGYYLKSICWAGKVESGETVSYYWDDNSESATTISAQTTSGTGVTYNAPSSTTKFTASYVDDGVDGGGIWWRNVQVEVCAAGVTTYSVTYDGNDETSGSVPTGATNYSYGATVTVLGNTGELEKTNYTFAGWSTNNDGTGSNYVADNTFSITANTTLYAKWTQAVTLDKNGGSTDGSATAVWNATGLTGITHATPVSGYKLTGYYTAATEGTKVLNSDGTFASSNVTDYITDGKWICVASTRTLYAQYEVAGSLTWVLDINTSATELGTNSKTSSFSQISTSNMSDAALAGSLTYEGSKKSALTGKISTPASYTAADSVYVTFQVASGYKFTPSSVKVKVQPVTTAKYAKLVLEDKNDHSIEYTTPSTIGAGSIGTVEITNGSGISFVGTVTLKIYCYGATDGYRLGTPIQIDGEVEARCATMPSFTQMNYTTTTFAPSDDASGSPITIVGGENIDTYQWKYNTTNDRTSGTNCGNGPSLDPLTDVTSGTTRYYWCEMTNDVCGITIKSPAVAITVVAAKSDATVSWTGTTASANYGGGGYTVTATVSTAGWDGTLTEDMLTAMDGVVLSNIAVTNDGKTISANFGVTEGANAEATNVAFYLNHPATTGYNAIDETYNTTTLETSCIGGGGGDGTSYDVRVRKNTTTILQGKSTVYGWDTPTKGFVTQNTSGSVTSTKSGYDDEPVFDSISKGNAKAYWVKSYVANVKKIRVYGQVGDDDLTATGVYHVGSFVAGGSSTAVAYSVIYEDEVDALKKGNHWFEITLDEAISTNDIIYFTVNKNFKIMGIRLTTVGAGGATLETALSAWSPAIDTRKEVYEDAASFIETVTKTGANANTMGAITYSSGDETIATVDNRTGRVTIANSITWGDAITYKDVTITASLAPSGCYQGKTATYTLRVKKLTCEEAAGTITASSEDVHVVIEGDEVKKCTEETVTLTLGGYEEGATSFQWYKDGVLQGDKTTASITTSEAGVWYAVSNKGCAVTSTNEITITNRSTSVHVTRLVKEWYIKNGRLTPDIALWQLGDDCSFVSVAASDGWDAGTDLTEEGIFYEQDGIVYMKGTEPKANTGTVQNYTLTLTVNDGCSNQTLDADGKKITIHHQQNTDKHVLAFIVSGTDKGDWTAGVTADQTTNVGLYNAIAANFDVLATNSRSTDDEQKLKEYYSQFDILCITDYPNTGDKGANKKSYVDALGALIDIRPILTMEAWVSKLANWKAKGLSGNPKNPSTRQYTMDLQCKDHEIFAGTDLTKVGEGDEAMYRVSMVDNTKEDYATLDATYGGGAHAEKDGYNYGGKPALQGFTFTEEMANDLLPIGLIDDGAGNPLQVGIERQRNMEARLMVLGINSYAMERLTVDGEQVVINALNYLMKKNAEDIADCSIYFTGGDADEDESTRNNWNVDSHWSNGTQPISTQKVRILAPCVIPSGVQVHVTDVLIVPDGPINHGADVADGSLTIEAGGALIVDGKVEETTAPNYFHPHGTSAENLVLNTSSSAQAALILDNENGDTQATVNLYSLGRKIDSKYQFQYFAVPMEYVAVNPSFAGTGIYTYVWHENGGWERRGYYTDLYAFEGVGITTASSSPGEYTMTGNLASTATQEITLTKDADGENIIGNSWTAPINIASLADAFAEDENVEKVVYIYITGNDNMVGAHSSTEVAGKWLAIPIDASGWLGWDGLKVIPAMQAFYIKATSETTLTMDYNSLVRTTPAEQLNKPLKAPLRAPVSGDAISMLKLRVEDSSTYTDLYMFEGSRFSDSYDNGWEAKQMGGDGYMQLYAQNMADKMAVLATDELEGTIVGFEPGKETVYTISFSGAGNGYYLNDVKMQTSTLIVDGGTYSFEYEAGDDANRFFISRTPFETPGIATGVTDLDAEAPKVQKIIYNDKLYIIRGGKVFSADGQLVK